MKISGFFFKLSIVFGVLLLNACSDDGNVTYYAQEAVKAKLKAPSSAEFHDVRVLQKTDKMWLVQVPVDAENSFGAKLANDFLVVIKRQGDDLVYNKVTGVQQTEGMEPTGAEIAAMQVLNGWAVAEYNVLGEKEISKSDFGDDYPLTVDKCTLYGVAFSNDENDRGVILVANGKKYGVNGTAKTWGRKHGFSPIEEIWKDDPQVKGLKISIAPILDEGEKLIEDKN